MSVWFDQRITNLQHALEEITGQVPDDNFRHECMEFVEDAALRLAETMGDPVYKG